MQGQVENEGRTPLNFIQVLNETSVNKMIPFDSLNFNIIKKYIILIYYFIHIFLLFLFMNKRLLNTHDFFVALIRSRTTGLL